MPKPFKPGCKRPVTMPPETDTPSVAVEMKKEEVPMIKVGKPAPDFTLAGYQKGEFANFSLSEYKGKWVLLCFYPGDFTFV